VRKNNLRTPSTLKLGVLAAMAFGVFVSAASASVVGGLLTGSAGSITVSLTGIVWNTDAGANPFGPPWNGEVVNGTSVTFAGCGGVLGTPGCLDVAPDAPNEAIEINGNVALTAGTVLPEPGFLLFSGNGTTHAVINYTLTQVLAGPNNTDCAGLAQFASCAIFLGSPLVLTLEGPFAVMSLNLAGTVSDGDGTTATWNGGFSATLAPQTPAEIQAFFCPGGVCSLTQTLTISNSGTFFSTVTTTPPDPGSGSGTPEPGSMILIVSGLIGLASLTRRKKT
jgi:hypothetical protein